MVISKKFTDISIKWISFVLNAQSLQTSIIIIKWKREIDRKINVYCHCIGCCFKKFVIINTEELSEKCKLYIKQCYCIVWYVGKIQKVKIHGWER